MTVDKNDFGCIQIEHLNADNYYIWSNDIEVFLRGKRLWKYAEGSISTPTESAELAQFEREGDMCLAYLLMTIEQSCKFAVIRMRSPSDVWKTLHATYQTVSESLIDAKLTQLQ